MAEQIGNVMLPTFFGMKAGMTRIFDSQGNHVPVTIIKLIPNIISQIKTDKKDGYQAYQVAYGEKREKLLTKPIKSHLKKAGIDLMLNRFSEISIDNIEENVVGSNVSYDSFKESDYVDVTSVSKGKGFQGVIKRYGFRGGPGAHGSHFHRAPGSIGNRATPARVFANKKMPGHMGNKKCTVQNLKVVSVNLDKGFMLLKGSVPGAKNSYVKVSRAVKK